MAVPKRRTSKSRSRMRRAANMKADFGPTASVKCPSCSEPKLPHRICSSCGKYGDRQVIPVVEG
jgi:large subunit ribosomal protein L32